MEFKKKGYERVPDDKIHEQYGDANIYEILEKR